MYTKTYQELTFADDFMFCKILSSDSDLCKRLVELLLGVNVKEIKYKDTHHEINLSPQQMYLSTENSVTWQLKIQSLPAY